MSDWLLGCAEAKRDRLITDYYVSASSADKAGLPRTAAAYREAGRLLREARSQDQAQFHGTGHHSAVAAQRENG